MDYRVVDSYYRQVQLDFFRRYRSPFYAVTFELDVTGFKRHVDERGLPTYVNLCWVFLRAMQGIEDFRYRLLDGRVVLYERLHPSLTVPAPGGRFSFCALWWDPDLDAFNRAAAAAMAAAGAASSLADPGRQNAVYFTALPGVPFTSFTHVVPDDPEAGQTQVAFGRFRDDGGRRRVPVGLQINHLFIDGAALGRLCDAAQRELDAFG
jgi:chloramphenicol O-acetyltransferase type A